MCDGPAQVSTAASAEGDEARPLWRRHLWELAAVRDIVVLGGILGALYLAYALRAATVPALIALASAYALEPVVAFTGQRWSWPRWLTSVGLLGLLMGLTTGAAVWFGPALVADTRSLVSTSADRVEALRQWARTTLPQGLRPAARPDSSLDPGLFFDGALQALDAASGALVLGGYLFVASVFTAIMFVVFSTKFSTLPQLSPWLPAQHRHRIERLLGDFEGVFAGYLRGQVLVALFTTTAFAIGFSLVGVTNALAIAAVGGLCSFIPNGQVTGPALAITFGLLEGSGDAVAAVALPLLVYVVTQSTETFVITPIVQSSQTRLPIPWVLAALIAGGSVGGLVGVFFAIPVTACIRILVNEVIAPAMRLYLEEVGRRASRQEAAPRKPRLSTAAHDDGA